MIALTSKERDKALLRLLYASAGRISEVCRLTWADVQPSGDSGQVTLFGKGQDPRGQTQQSHLESVTGNS
jgi:site-specific recombinase XerD